MASSSRLSPNVIGAAWMLGSALFFALMTTLVKFLGEGYPASLQTLYRQAVALLVMLPLMLRYGRAAFATGRPWLMLYRAAASTLGIILSFYSFQHLPLADANAFSFTRVLWVVPLAALVLREQVGVLRISAVLAGFGGVLVMINPSPSGLSLGWAEAAALASSLLLASSIIAIKSMTRDHSYLPMLTWSAVFGFLIAVPPGIATWQVPTLPDLGLLVAMGVFGILVQLCFVRAMQSGDAAAMAPLDYTRLVFGVAAGLLLFDEIPTLTTMVGAGIVVAATLFITLREHQLARRGLRTETIEEQSPTP